MIKVFDTTQEYNTYTSNGLQSGDLYYVLDDGSVHFRTNNIDGEDKVYDKVDGGGSEPDLTSVLISLLQKDGTGTFIIPDGTNSIGEYGLAYSEYNEIIIPNSVTKFNRCAFNNCHNLTSIIIPDSVTYIDYSTFNGCGSLTSITIPDSVTYIGEMAFYNCASLTSVTVNATTPPTLGSMAFNNTNNCPIYVPSQCVDTYKSATNWSTWANRIQAIS